MKDFLDGSTFEDGVGFLGRVAETGFAFPVTEFGARGDGRADDTAAFERAIAAARGNVVWVPEGRYRTALRASASVLRLAGPGTLLARPGAPALIHEPAYGAPRPVERIAVEPWPAAKGPLHTILRCDPAGLAIGDVVHLSTTRRYAWFKSAFAAETAEIVAIDGRELALDHRLHDIAPGEEGVLLLPFPKSRVEIDGLGFSTESAIDRPGLARAPALDLRAPDRPILRARCEAAYERFAILRAPWLGRVEVETTALRDWPAEGVYGYGVCVIGAGFGTQIRVQGTRCRHIVTGDIFKPRRHVLRDLCSHGRPRNVRVHDSLSVGGHGGAAFDTHQGCLRWTFANCAALHPRIDPDGEPLAAGFSDRGQHTTFDRCSVLGGTRGFRLNVSAVPYPSNHTRLIHCSAAELSGAGARAIEITGSDKAPPTIETHGFAFDDSGAFEALWGGAAHHRVTARSGVA